jgi:hypothetical protein
MFTWICPRCGREVPPAYDECPDCAGKVAAEAVTGSAPPPGAVAPPQQSQPAAPPPGPRGARRPLWASGQQEPLTPAPPPAFAPPPPVRPAAAAPPEAPPTFRPHQPTSPLFQAPPPAPQQYVPPQPQAPPAYRPHQSTSPLFQDPAPAPQQFGPPQYVPPSNRTPTWLTGVAIGVIVVMFIGALYWFFGRSQPTSAVTEAPAAAPTAAGESPAQKYIEVAGVRFSPMTKGVQVAFVLINHSDSDIVGLTGTATILAKTNKGDETPVGTIQFQTSMAAEASKELQLPFQTKLKMMEMPDWQNVSVKIQITSPPGA